jgi:hypothetical protein
MHLHKLAKRNRNTPNHPYNYCTPYYWDITCRVTRLEWLLEYEILAINNNSAGAKTLGVTVNGTGISATASTTNTNNYVRKTMKLTGSLTTKMLSPPQSMFGPTANTVTMLNQNLALGSDATIAVTLTSAAASDFNSTESILITGRRYS